MICFECFLFTCFSLFLANFSLIVVMEEEAEEDSFHVLEKTKEEKEIIQTHPISPIEINLRLHALVDIGDFLLGFTIEDIGGGHEARARVFDLHTRTWLPIAVPILPSIEEGEELPIDGRWQMQLIEYSTILCIYTNPSNCRLIYLHLDRSPTKSYPLSLFVSHSRDIRPVLSILLDRSLNCTVLYERKYGAEQVSIISDDYQLDRDSVRVHEENEEGRIIEMGPCNLTNTTDDHLIARSSTRDILLTRKRGKGILIDRETGIEKIVDIRVEPEEEQGPFFKSSSFILVDGRSLSIDSSGFLWSLDATHLVWKKHSMQRFKSGDISSLTHTWNGRLLCVHDFKRKKPGKSGESYEVFQPLWKWIQPATLKDLAQSKVCVELLLDGEGMKSLHRELEIHRRDYDTTTAFVMAIQKRREQ